MDSVASAVNAEKGGLYSVWCETLTDNTLSNTFPGVYFFASFLFYWVTWETVVEKLKVFDSPFLILIFDYTLPKHPVVIVQRSRDCALRPPDVAWPVLRP